MHKRTKEPKKQIFKEIFFFSLDILPLDTTKWNWNFMHCYFLQSRKRNTHECGHVFWKSRIQGATTWCISLWHHWDPTRIIWCPRTRIFWSGCNWTLSKTVEWSFINCHDNCFFESSATIAQYVTIRMWNNDTALNEFRILHRHEMVWDRCQTFTKSIKSIIKFAYDPGLKVVKA